MTILPTRVVCSTGDINLKVMRIPLLRDCAVNWTDDHFAHPGRLFNWRHQP
nr:MAG TPA: hypothetical protein [Caudoviricetes sp.]